MAQRTGTQWAKMAINTSPASGNIVELDIRDAAKSTTW